LNNKKQIILIFFTGLIVALFLLEIGLRIVGGISRNNLAPEAISVLAKEEKQYCILCLGNSFTAGYGAPKGKSYPSQLQKLFNKETKGKKVKVINAGVGNQNSAELLSMLEYNIIRWNPDLIILQTGQPNFWNQYKYKMYLERKRSVRFFRKSIFYLNDFLYCSRVYRLSLLLIHEMKKRSANQNLQIKKRDPYYSEIIERFRLLEITKEMSPFDQGKLEETVNFLKREVAFFPREVNNYRFIGDIYFFQNKHKEAAEWFIRGIKADPGYRRNGEGNKNYFLLSMVYRCPGNEKVRKLIDEFMDEFRKSNPEYSENLIFLRNQEIYDWIESDIKEIIRIVQNKKIKIILQNYPPPAINIEKVVYFNSIFLSEIAKDHNIAFVDNCRIFQEILDRGAKRDDFFVPDGHCNAKGYEVMAMNIFNKIKEEGMIEPDK